MNFNLADSQQALGFLVSQTAHIETEVYEIQYPDIQYPELVPIDTSANEWATTVTFYSSDKMGEANWFNHMAKDMPRADVERDKHDHSIHMAGIGYGYTLEELGQAMMVPNTNLSNDRAAAARRAYEEFMDNLALRGNTAKSWTGLINNATATTVTAVDGATSSTAWSAKTPDEILADINTAISGMWTASLNIELADTILLPYAEISRLVSKRVTDTNMTVWDFLMRSNLYTSQTGQQLMIRGVRGLETASDDGSGRMVAYRRDPSVLKLHLPMPHRFLPVWQTGPMAFDVPGIFRTGGLEVRRPGALRYMDGITADATS